MVKSPESEPAAAGRRIWAFEDLDRRWAKELQAKLPPAMFDIHAHLYRADDMRVPWTGLVGEGPRDVDLNVYRQCMRRQLGQRRLAGSLFVPFPTPEVDAATANAWVVEQAKRHVGSRALVLARPDADPATLRALADEPVVAGLKVYHTLSDNKPTFHSQIEGYAPAWVWQLCDEHGWVLLLHMVRTRALADEFNSAAIRRLCEQHPRVKLVLAHAGRGFNKWDTVFGIGALRGLENVWFDTSGVCETEALVAILNEFGPRRLMWGSDFPVSEQRGKCVSVGDRFSWINPVTTDANNPQADPCPTTVVGLESLRAVLHASDLCCLDEADRADVFHDNAARLLGLLAEAPGRGQALYRKARKIIPGGVQLLSKRPEMWLPEGWPAYYRRARGCETWDLDGRRYYDMSISGIGACLLGFADPDVDAAVTRVVRNGSMASLNPPEEVELAERLCEIHPWAAQARFTRTGGEAMAAAVRIARATTGRSGVAFCGYHGWHDWYLAANLGGDQLQGHLLPGLAPLGVPAELAGTMHPFAYNDLAALETVVAEHGPRLAAIVMEPVRSTPPAAGFLAGVKQLAKRCGAVLIFDEITIGWRLCYGGAHKALGVQPDLAAFAKATSNGYPLGAVIGTEAAMEGAHRSFISSSYWTERIGPAAGVATLRKMSQIDVPAHLRKVGALAGESWRRHAEATGLPVEVDDACPALCHFAWKHPQAQELKTLYTQLMLDEGFLAGLALYATWAHTPEILERHDLAVGRAFKVIAEAIGRNEITSRLRGPVAHTGFGRLVN